MIEWLSRQDPSRVFIADDEVGWTYGEIASRARARPVSGVEVLRPGPGVESVVDLFAVISKGTAVLLGRDAHVPDVADPGDAAVVVLTSGTTGAPKGVRLTRANWDSAVAASAEHLGHTARDTWLLAMPLHHVGGLSILLRSAFVGGSVRLLSGFSPESFAEALRDDVTIASVVPTMLARVLDVDIGPFPDLKAVLVGGGPVDQSLLERAVAAGMPALPTYGMTETCGQVATLRPGSKPERRAHPLPGVELRIETDGRIAVRGPMVSPGYLGGPDRHPHDWLVTNDLGELDDAGALSVLGRADDVIVTGGENVSPSAVEQVLLASPDVEKVLVVGVPSEEWGMEVACLYVGTATESDLGDWSRQRLAPHQVPKRWRRVESLPRGKMGKADRAEAARLFS